jgi:hypothetical protein
MATLFVSSTVMALFERATVSLDFWSVVSAAETASWRLKGIAFPFSVFALWGGFLLYRSINRAPTRFGGRLIARAGLASVVTVAVIIASAIAITIPERMRQHRTGTEAGESAKFYAFYAIQLKYRAQYGTFAAVLDDLTKLPDPDGSIAKALRDFDPKGYQARSELAVSLPKAKAGKRQGAALRNISTNSRDDSIPQGLSFTSFELRLPGPDKILGTDDDPRMVDGVVDPQTQSDSASASVEARP